MRRAARPLIALIAFSIARGVLLPAQSTGTQVRELLPLGRVTVEVLELWSPARLVQLRDRLQRAVQNDPAWFQEHIRRASPGQPLAYDSRLGLSQPEYREFLRLADSVQMRPSRTATVSIESTPTGWRFGVDSEVKALRGIEIDTVRNQIHSPFGDLAAAEPIAPSRGQRATGPWGGPRWKLEVVLDEATVSGTVAQFAVGRHQSGHTVIYYDAKRAANRQVSAQESVFLRVVP